LGPQNATVTARIEAAQADDLATAEHAKERILSFLKGLLRATSDELTAAADESPPSAIEILTNILDRFHLVARQLNKRHANRQPFIITDEYDVQDLLHALLKLSFDDIRPEEWTPSYAGSPARMDFLLKDEQIVVEVKKTSRTVGAKEVGDQLLVDIARYVEHPNFKTLVCRYLVDTVAAFDAERLRLLRAAGILSARVQEGDRITAAVRSGEGTAERIGPTQQRTSQPVARILGLPLLLGIF
jgi:hypothetical protein